MISKSMALISSLLLMRMFEGDTSIHCTPDFAMVKCPGFCSVGVDGKIWAIPKTGCEGQRRPFS